MDERSPDDLRKIRFRGQIRGIIVRVKPCILMKRHAQPREWGGVSEFLFASLSGGP